MQDVAAGQNGGTHPTLPGSDQESPESNGDFDDSTFGGDRDEFSINDFAVNCYAFNALANAVRVCNGDSIFRAAELADHVEVSPMFGNAGVKIQTVVGRFDSEYALCGNDEAPGGGSGEP